MQVLRREIVNVFPMQGNDIYGAAGRATVALGIVPAGFMVEVERLSISAATGTEFTLYAYSVDNDLNIREHTLIGVDTKPIADENSPVRFFPGEEIIARFVGGTPGDAASVYGQAWIVLYVPTEIDASGGGEASRSSGRHDVDGSKQPDPGGWN